MDQCLTEEPDLVSVGHEIGHLSACYLPRTAAGLGDQAEEQRLRTVGSHRHGEAAEVAQTIADSPLTAGDIPITNSAVTDSAATDSPDAEGRLLG